MNETSSVFLFSEAYDNFIEMKQDSRFIRSETVLKTFSFKERKPSKMSFTCTLKLTNAKFHMNPPGGNKRVFNLFSSNDQDCQNYHVQFFPQIFLKAKCPMI